MFIGRETELSFLNNQYNSRGGALVVLYGRRRVGKTETLKEFCADKEHVFYSCRECTDEEQLRSFSARVLTPNMPAYRYIKSFDDWTRAFSSVTELPHKGKKLLVIDEFPYMARNNRGIASILQNLWDESLKDENVMIILCGSSMSFIENEVLAEKNPLYGRATGIIRMTEMDYIDAVKFFPNYGYEDKILAYSVLGGIPHYLKQFDDSVPLEDNIKKKILDKASILYGEIEFLLKQELRETALYNMIIEAVALGNTKLNAIFTKTNIDKTKLSVYIKNLISLGIVKREFSVDIGIKERANIHRGLYGLTDNFFCFWYYFVFGNISELEAGDIDGVYKYAVAPELNRYASYRFEDICKSFIRKQQIKGRLPFRYDKLGRYLDAKTEIDIMAVSKDKKTLLAGECKFKNSPFDFNDFNALKNKIPGAAEQVYYYLFSKSGFTKGLKERIHDDITLVDIADLFDE